MIFLLREERADEERADFEGCWAMRLMSFTNQGEAGWGLVDGDGVADLTRAMPGIASLKALLASGRLNQVAAAAAGAPRLELSALRFLPPIPDPAKTLCIGVNYLGHIKEMGREVPSAPTIFVRFADAQIGHGGALQRPRNSVQYDYEGELALVIGRAGRHISPSSALDHVAGWACFNDGTVRDWQNAASQFTPGKNFPASGAFGPWLVTSDEIPDPSALRIQTRLNGVTVQDAPVSDLVFNVPKLIAYCSAFTPLRPGDVIVTGTPSGVGAGRRPPLWMKAGDRVEIEISGIGVLANPVEDEPDPA